MRYGNFARDLAGRCSITRKARVCLFDGGARAGARGCLGWVVWPAHLALPNGYGAAERLNHHEPKYIHKPFAPCLPVPQRGSSAARHPDGSLLCHQRRVLRGVPRRLRNRRVTFRPPTWIHLRTNRRRRHVHPVWRMRVCLSPRCTARTTAVDDQWLTFTLPVAWRGFALKRW